MKAVDIIWTVDCEDDLESLPTEVEIPEGMEDEDEIADYLSDTFGFCHEGFVLDTDADTVSKGISPHELYEASAACNAR